MKLNIFVVLVLLSPSASALARVWYVPGDAPTIQAGIDSASSGDIVEVACGTYYEHDIRIDKSIILRSQQGVASCVTIDAGESGRVILCDDVLGNIRIRGFTITGGDAGHASYHSGSGGGIGIPMGSGKVEIVDSRISSNYAPDNGGGIAAGERDVTIIRCTLEDNVCDSGGAAIDCWNDVGDKVLQIISSAITGNISGLDMAVYASGALQISSCTVRNNDGGGVHAANEEVTWIEGSTITNNTGPYDGFLAGGAYYDCECCWYNFNLHCCSVDLGRWGSEIPCLELISKPSAA